MEVMASRWKASIKVGIASVMAGGATLAYQLYQLRVHLSGMLPEDHGIPSSHSQSPFIYVDFDWKGDGKREEAGNVVKVPFHKRSHWWLHPWILLKMTMVTTSGLRREAIRRLASMDGLSDGDYIQLAQAMPPETAVSLARMKLCSPKCFLPPPHPLLQHVKHETVLEGVLDLLTKCSESTPLADVVEFIVEGIHSKTVKDFSEHWNQWTADETQYPEDVQGLDSLDLLLLALQILHIQSHNFDKAQVLVREGILCTLLDLQRDLQENLAMIKMIGSILGNLSFFPELHGAIIQSGWLRTLSEWQKKKEPEFYLTAAKVLFNLDRNTSMAILPPSLYLLHPFTYEEEEEETKGQVIFIHGILGGVFMTWRQNDAKRFLQTSHLPDPTYSYCWPRDWLPTDVSGVTLYGIHYESQLTTWGELFPDGLHSSQGLNERSEKLLNQLLEARISEKPIIWVAHSMGGLLLKAMLVKAHKRNSKDTNQLLKSTKGIVFLSVPHKGSALATLNPRLQRFLKPATDVAQLRKGSPILSELNEDFLSLLANYKISVESFVETIDMKVTVTLPKLTWVTPTSADIGVGTLWKIKTNHRDICKPMDKSSVVYQSILQMTSHMLKKP